MSLRIQKRGEELYYVALVINDDQIILFGNDCPSLIACKYSIDSIRANATDFSKYELITSCGGKYHCKLKGSDGKEIAQSEIFNSKDECYAIIDLVRRSIPYAIIENTQKLYNFN